MDGVYYCVFCGGVFPFGEGHACIHDQNAAARRQHEYQQAQKDRRDRFAMAALTGVLVSDYAFVVSNPDRASEMIARLADSAIAELDKEK